MNIPTESELILLNKQEEKFLRFLEQYESEDESEARYSVTINIEVRFTRSKAKEAQAVRLTKDPKAPAIRLTEDHLKERYPWDYEILTKKCRQLYTDFKANQNYHDIRINLQSDSRFAYIRRLDPDNPNSSRKVFFNPSILAEFDKYYMRKKVKNAQESFS